MWGPPTGQHSRRGRRARCRRPGPRQEARRRRIRSGASLPGAYPARVRAEVVVDIDRSPEDVFAYLTDVSNLPKWQSGVHSAEREGDLIHESRTMLGRHMENELQIVD